MNNKNLTLAERVDAGILLHGVKTRLVNAVGIDKSKRQLHIRFKQSILHAIFLITSMKLDIQTLMSGEMFPKGPYSKGNRSKRFFEAVKQNEIDRVKAMIDKDEFIVYEYNYFK